MIHYISYSYILFRTFTNPCVTHFGDDGMLHINYWLNLHYIQHIYSIPTHGVYIFIFMDIYLSHA